MFRPSDFFKSFLDFLNGNLQHSYYGLGGVPSVNETHFPTDDVLTFEFFPFDRRPKRFYAFEVARQYNNISSFEFSIHSFAGWLMTINLINNKFI